MERVKPVEQLQEQSQRHFVNYKTHISWPGIEPVCNGSNLCLLINNKFYTVGNEKSAATFSVIILPFA